ncbi:MAG: hypothetical protein K1X64_14900, partial [Myxococcaceae bacterium]|nr:hypothetical protein [Myxococcaceae bacterium]
MLVNLNQPGGGGPLLDFFKQLLGDCGSLKAGDMIGDEARGALKTSKGGAQRGVAFVGRSV